MKQKRWFRGGPETQKVREDKINKRHVRELMPNRIDSILWPGWRASQNQEWMPNREERCFPINEIDRHGNLFQTTSIVFSCIIGNRVQNPGQHCHWVPWPFPFYYCTSCGNCMISYFLSATKKWKTNFFSCSTLLRCVTISISLSSHNKYHKS